MSSSYPSNSLAKRLPCVTFDYCGHFSETLGLVNDVWKENVFIWKADVKIADSTSAKLNRKETQMENVFEIKNAVFTSIWDNILDQFERRSCERFWRYLHLFIGIFRTKEKCVTLYTASCPTNPDLHLGLFYLHQSCKRRDYFLRSYCKVNSKWTLKMVRKVGEAVGELPIISGAERKHFAMVCSKRLYFWFLSNLLPKSCNFLDRRGLQYCPWNHCHPSQVSTRHHWTLGTKLVGGWGGWTGTFFHLLSISFC